MQVFIPSNSDSGESRNSLIEGLRQAGVFSFVKPDTRAGVITVVGAGGKTNTVYSLAGELVGQADRVVVTTTTHMFLNEEHGILLGTEGGISADALPWQKDTYLMLASEIVKKTESGRKSKGITEEQYERLLPNTDWLVIEGDGAKRLPFKVPADHEPVIPEETDLILIVMGLSALGHPLNQVACRLPQLCQILEVGEEEILTERHAAKALWEGYWKPLSRKFPYAKLCVILNQADAEADREKGARISRELDVCAGKPVPCLMTTRTETERMK